MLEVNKTLFLDIDGVLATHKEFMKPRHIFRKKYDVANTLRIPYPFNPGSVKILNSIIEETDVNIVLTSDWRNFWDLNELDQIFKFNGVIKSPMSITNTHPISMENLTENRKNEIKEYIETFDVGTYVIVDDMKLDMERFVKTKDTEGLKQLGVKKKILNFLK